MAWPLIDLAGDLAVAQARPRIPSDPAEAEALDALIMRRRLAGIAWIPGAFGALAIGSGWDSVPLGIAAFAVLMVGLWLFAERGDRLWARVRGLKT